MKEGEFDDVFNFINFEDGTMKFVKRKEENLFSQIQLLIDRIDRRKEREINDRREQLFEKVSTKNTEV